MSQVNDDSIAATAKRVLAVESAAVSRAVDYVDSAFTAACHSILSCNGRTVVTGIGKSGHIAAKIASTLASTGTPAFYVHPAEASHGDLGMITNEDVVLMLSYSGETAELLTLLPALKRKGCKLLSMTGNASSTLATQSDIHILSTVEKEACPIGLAPTASSTVALALGDALALALLEARGFNADDFALSHPGGSLGKRLLLKVCDLMHTGDDIPKVSPNTTLGDALIEMAQKRLGVTTVVESDGCLLGIFTDGDLRRSIDSGDFMKKPIFSSMTADCVTIAPEQLSSSALLLMQQHRIQVLPVVDLHGHLAGILHMQDLLQAGVV
ncbi:MAG: KpsF/GutQ family sugar-phosphate isomerase [Candidatus Porifericomitaceae bacterium WSBS_2022_MAG_OTU9]